MSATDLRPHLGPLALVVVMAVGAFWNSLDNGFHFDDEHSLTENPHIRDIGNVPRFFADPQMFSRNPGSEMYRPLVLTSYAFNYQLGGLRPKGYHVANLIAHIAAAVGLYALLQAMGSGRLFATAGAVMFSVHPVATEPVNYISSRSETMAAVLLLFSFVAYVRARDVGGVAVAVSAICFLAGLLCKESVIVLIPLLLLYERFLVPERKSEWWQWQLPHWAIGALYILLTRGLISEALTEPVRPLPVQLATQAKAMVYYAKLLVIPYPLNVEHSFSVSETWQSMTLIASVALALSGAYLMWRAYARGMGVPAFWLTWMMLALLPTAIVPLNMIVNERRLYPVLIGFIGLLLWMAARSARAGPFFLAASVVFTTLTVQRNPVWATELTLWRDAASKAPEMPRPHLRLGVWHRGNGELDAAEAAYRRTLALDPGSAPALNNLGNVLRLKGDLAGAEEAYNRSLQLLPSYPEALINLAGLLNKRGQFEAALRLYQQAEPLAANRPEFHNNRGLCHLELGQFTEAERALRRSISLDPDNASSHYNLGGALEGLHKQSEAEAAYRRASRLDAAFAKPHFKLAQLYERQGRVTASVEAYEMFLSLWHGDAEFSERLGSRVDSLRHRMADR